MRRLTYLSLVIAAACTIHQDLGSNGSDAQRECATDQCGPALGLPNYTCPDGTVAGPTGRCLEGQGGTCAWEVVSCPSNSCKPEDCANQPIEAIACAPGYLTAQTCEVNAQGKCGWKIGCTPLDGGTGTSDGGTCVCSDPRPLAPNEMCPDGSIGGPVCTAQSDGTCSWAVRVCPSEGGVACLPSECTDTNQCALGSNCVNTTPQGPCVIKQCCPAFGCNPMCPNGVLKDAKGCDTCQCAPTTTCQVDGDCPALLLCVPCGENCAARKCVSGTCQWVCP
ncbi:MAG TPA: hypothetical protein VF881_11575 [Polyangiaceae bacterium]